LLRVTLTSGTRLGPYEIVAPLGAGGMGEVWRARDARLGRDVAIKALPQALARDPESLARFDREARLLASLNHPNIAAIYGLEDAAGVPHLVLELVEGESLAARVARGALEPRTALQVAVQVASAIEAAHERGIVHRDLKPGNVMLDASGTVKVLDFGLAKGAGGAAEASPDSPTMAGVTAPGLILGTAAYMSPEQARGLAVDRRSDVWSFGCILFECLAGRSAFAGATVSDLIARILEREPDWTALPAGLPPRARDVLKRCLRKNADERPRDIRDVRLELIEAASGGAKAEPAGQQSIVVLPFTHAPGTDDEYFADGITEEILNALAQLEGLRVAARTSSFAFKGKNEDLRVVAEKLDVTTVLEGSVRRSGDRLRITVRLINAADGYQMWSERYDRELTDVFAVQDEIANAIAARLKLSLGGAPWRVVGRGTESLEAYELFLKGRAVVYLRGRHLYEALSCFQQALAIDPDYPDALAWMSDAYRNQATFGMAPSAEVMPRAREAAERALALDPNQAEAHATLADVEAQYDRDWARAARSWERALALDPRLTRARCERAMWSFGFGGFTIERAVAGIADAVADDPLNAWAHGMHSMILNMQGREEESVAAARRGVEVDPSSFFAQYNLLRSLTFSGRSEEALALGPAHLRATGRQIWSLVALAGANALAGHVGVAQSLHDELEARARSEFVSPAWMASAASMAGRIDRALELARRGVEQRDPFALLARVMPYWAPMRERPEFAEIVARMKFLPG
jgi:serine/threonine-protein kinase